MGCKDCDSGKGSFSHRDAARSLAERALKLAMSLPDDATCYKHFKKSEAAFLSSLRDMAASLSFAHSWTESELRSRADGFVLADAALTYGLEAARMNNGGGTGKSCTELCNDDKDRCTARCNADPDAGYFCYFDCRLTYMACLARCITHGVFGGGAIAA